MIHRNSTCRTVHLGQPVHNHPTRPFPYEGGLPQYVVEAAEGYFAEGGSIDRFALLQAEQVAARVDMTGLDDEEALDAIDAVLVPAFEAALDEVTH